MSCIKIHSLVAPTLKNEKFINIFKSAKLLPFDHNQPRLLIRRQRPQNTTIPAKTKAMLSPHILASATTATPPDLSVLLPTSALLLLVYWVANFVVPEIVYKDLLSDETNDDGKTIPGTFSGDEARNASNLGKGKNGSTSSKL